MRNVLYFCFVFLTALRSKVFNCKLYCSYKVFNCKCYCSSKVFNCKFYCSSKVLTCKFYSSSKVFSCKFYGFSKNLISPVDSEGNAKHLQSVVIC
jgi:hypothetical protein